MSAQPAEQPDDLMALADAVGVTPASRQAGAHDQLVNYRPHPSIRPYLADPALDAVVSRWSRDIKYGVLAQACDRCGGVGMVPTRSFATGAAMHVTCLTCNGTGER